MTDTPEPIVELLAPAGGPDALVAAVNNGADAVYLGVGSLNARRGAANFDLETLSASVSFAHLRGVRVYLTANIVLLPSEMHAALDMIDQAWASGIDAVIVQDLGLLRAVRQTMPGVRLHASTQIDVMNPSAVRVLAGLGVTRVTLARELPFDAIGRCAAVGTEVETFVHGALCYSYSGQCLMSSLIGQRSANRGLCAQPCRMPYRLIDRKGNEATVPGRYLLSTRDLAGIAHLPQLVSAGVASLKIEGRMKSPEYVAIVTSVYRAALDRALRDPDSYEVSPGEWERLEEAFSRGFTDGYLTGKRAGDLMSYGRPNNRGVLVGRVRSTTPGTAEVDLERAIDPADTLEFWTRSGRFAQGAGHIEVGGARVAVAPAGAVARIGVERPVSEGDRVFRVANGPLQDAARRTYSADAAERHATPVDLEVRVRIGQPLCVRATTGGLSAVASGDEVTSARTKPVTAEEIVEHVGRLGGSGYRPAGWSIDLDAGAGVGFSALHRLRREALEGLDALRLAPWAGRTRSNPRPPALRERSAGREPVAVVVTAWDAASAGAAVRAGADEVWLRVFPGDDVGALPDRVRPLLPRIVWPNEAQELTRFIDGGAVLTGDLGTLADAARAGETHADWPLNLVNAHTAEALSEIGAACAWASPELSGRQLADVVAHTAAPLGCLVWGRTELMVAEQCVLQAAGPCGRGCATCGRRTGWWLLRDEKGYEFPVTTDRSGRSHILNSVTLDLTRALDEVIASGVAKIRVDFSDEGPERTLEVVRSVIATARAIEAGTPAPASALVSPSTSGHFFRGIR